MLSYLEEYKMTLKNDPVARKGPEAKDKCSTCQQLIFLFFLAELNS